MWRLHASKCRELMRSRGLAQVIKYLRVRGLATVYYEVRAGFARGITVTCPDIELDRAVNALIHSRASLRGFSHEEHSRALWEEVQERARWAKIEARWAMMRPYPAPMTAVYHSAL